MEDNATPPSPCVQIMPQDSGWAKACSAEIAAIHAANAPARMFIDHVGSTAVAGLESKPVIDLLLTLVDWEDAGRIVAGLAAIGYAEEEAHIELPRHFLARTASSGASVTFHLHLVPLDSKWGRNMLVFRDELVADRELARRYVTLKRQLAAAHPDDLEAYTNGKSEFVTEVLRKAAGTFGNERLLTYQRAELDCARAFQDKALAAQLAVAIVTAISVYSDNNTTQLNFALAGFLLAALWLALTRKQRAHRAAGDQARRVVLLASGLGEHFSAEQRLRVFDGFKVSIADRALVREEEHFASRAPPGYRRLAELIEESAYWTRDLQQASATWLQTTLLIAALAIAGLLWAGILTLSADQGVSFARVAVALLVFLLSSDLIGAIFAHREAAATIAVILQRVETAAARDFPQADILLLMSDYNAAVESAPFALPFVYWFRSAELTRRWRNYLENKRG
ncbi:MAG: GrpB family protein [Sphingomonadales bacterium]|nr:MAG: GrpB family protein [Sphingomonadales bacterium]